MTRDSHNFETPARMRELSESPVITRRASGVLRLALGLDEAAEALGCSRDYFDEHVRPEIRTVRRGRRILVPVKELERWLERSASRALK
jgi:excisionase family DNA binding protein